MVAAFLPPDHLMKLIPNLKVSHFLINENNRNFYFLDTLINNDESGTHASVYRKKIRVEVFSNFLSFQLCSYKIGLLKTLIYCTFEVSND